MWRAAARLCAAGAVRTRVFCVCAHVWLSGASSPGLGCCSPSRATLGILCARSGVYLRMRHGQGQATTAVQVRLERAAPHAKPAAATATHSTVRHATSASGSFCQPPASCPCGAARVTGSDGGAGLPAVNWGAQRCARQCVRYQSLCSVYPRRAGFGFPMSVLQNCGNQLRQPRTAPRTSRARTSSAPANAAWPCCGPSRPPSWRRCLRRGGPRGGPRRRRRRSWRRWSLTAALLSIDDPYRTPGGFLHLGRGYANWPASRHPGYLWFA